LVIMDCNPPTIRHWIYEVFEKERPEGFKIYKMAPAIVKNDRGIWINNPDADYIWQVAKKNEYGDLIEPKYWTNLALGATDDYIKVSLCGEYGMVEAGRAVHPEYNDALHYANRTIQPNTMCEIGLGWDFGLTPACIIIQLMPDGQFVVLDELWTERMALRQFAEDIVIPHLDRHYSFWRKNYVSIHDPAGSQGAQTDGRTCQDILLELGISSLPADSNSPEFRRDGLKYFLTKLSNGSPSFLLSDKCQFLREGLLGKYKYEQIKSATISSEIRYQEKPIKNLHSHSCEALEYICTHYARVNKEYRPTNGNLPYEFAQGSFMGR